MAGTQPQPHPQVGLHFSGLERSPAPSPTTRVLLTKQNHLDRRAAAAGPAAAAAAGARRHAAAATAQPHSQPLAQLVDGAQDLIIHIAAAQHQRHHGLHVECVLCAQWGTWYE